MPRGGEERPRRDRSGKRTAPVVTRFSFVNSYSVVDKDENPLCTGVLKDERNDTKKNYYGVKLRDTDEDEPEQDILHLDLKDLVAAKQSFMKDLSVEEVNTELSLKCTE